MAFGSGMQLQQLAPLMQLFAQLQAGGAFGGGSNFQRPQGVGPALPPEQQRAALMAPQGGQFYAYPGMQDAWGMIGNQNLYNPTGQMIGTHTANPDMWQPGSWGGISTPPWLQSLQPTMGSPLQRPNIAPVAPSPVTGAPTGATNPAVAAISQPAPEIKSQIAMDPFRSSKGIFGGGFGAF